MPKSLTSYHPSILLASYKLSTITCTFLVIPFPLHVDLFPRDLKPGHFIPCRTSFNHRLRYYIGHTGGLMYYDLDEHCI